MNLYGIKNMRFIWFMMKKIVWFFIYKWQKKNFSSNKKNGVKKNAILI